MYVLNMQGKDAIKDSPKIFLVSSQEHIKLVKKDPFDLPSIFDTNKETGIPDAKERVTSVAELNRFAVFKQLVDMFTMSNQLLHFLCFG